MRERSDALNMVDTQIAELQTEGLPLSVAILHRFRSAITGTEPIDEVGVLALFSQAFEDLERRVVALESAG